MLSVVHIDPDMIDVLFWSVLELLTTDQANQLEDILTNHMGDKRMNLDQEIEIVCKIHGPFRMRAGDHIGQNLERVAYGCPKCGDDKPLNIKPNFVGVTPCGT